MGHTWSYLHYNVVKTMPFAPSPSHHHKYIAGMWVWINTYRYIFLVGWTSINPSYDLGWTKGTRVLTHPHMWDLTMDFHGILEVELCSTDLSIMSNGLKHQRRGIYVIKYIVVCWWLDDYIMGWYYLIYWGWSEPINGKYGLPFGNDEQFAI